MELASITSCYVLFNRVEQLKASLPCFTCKLMQMPPLYCLFVKWQAYHYALVVLVIYVFVLLRVNWRATWELSWSSGIRSIHVARFATCYPKCLSVVTLQNQSGRFGFGTLSHASASSAHMVHKLARVPTSVSTLNPS